MRVAVSGAAVPDLTLEATIEAARGAGFEAIELWLPTLWPALERMGPESVSAALKRGRLGAVAMTPVPDITFRDQTGREAVAAQVHGAAALARAVGADWVVVQPGERPDGADARDALREGRDSVGRLCQVSERYDVGLALMPLGFEWASLRTVGDALRVIEGVGRRSLGFALDTFHFHAGRSSLDDLKACPARAIALLRLADAPDRDPGDLRDQHRLPPGEGVAPLRQIAAIVRAIGADPAVVVDAPMPRGSGDPAGWLARLRAAAQAVVRGAAAASPA